MAGRRVTVPETILSVYGTSPPGTYMMYAMDPDRIAGLNFQIGSVQEKYLPEGLSDLPVVGGWFGQGQTPNLETLLTVKPDIALVWIWKGSALVEKMEETLTPLGIPLVYISLDSIEDYPEAFRFLGDLLGIPERGEALARYASRAMGEIKQVVDTIPESGRVAVYYAEGADGLQTDGATSIHAELIPLCGGNNVHMGDGRTRMGMEKISMEQVLLYAPQVILTHDEGFYSGLFTDSRWASIPAVSNRRVYRIPTQPFNWFDRPPSFMRILGAKWLLTQLYPDAYAIDMVAETQAFYNLFLNVSLGDGEALELLAP